MDPIDENKSRTYNSGVFIAHLNKLAHIENSYKDLTTSTTTLGFTNKTHVAGLLVPAGPSTDHKHIEYHRILTNKANDDAINSILDIDDVEDRSSFTCPLVDSTILTGHYVPVDSDEIDRRNYNPTASYFAQGAIFGNVFLVCETKTGDYKQLGQVFNINDVMTKVNLGEVNVMTNADPSVLIHVVKDANVTFEQMFGPVYDTLRHIVEQVDTTKAKKRFSFTDRDTFVLYKGGVLLKGNSLTPYICLSADTDKSTCGSPFALQNGFCVRHTPPGSAKIASPSFSAMMIQAKNARKSV